MFWSKQDSGASLLEVLLVLAIVSLLTGISVPMSRVAVDAGRARQAAAFVASRFRLARIEALNHAANVGVVFDLLDGRWSIRICRDGNRNGLRRADIRAGVDPCVDGPHRFSAMFPGVEIAVDPTLRGPAGEPPSPDPVRFGTSDMASFSPNGSCTAGSLFVRTPLAQQYAVRMAGVNGRLRVFRYEVGARLWREL
jgi:type II secretory pathway pseudopilin PulG